MKMLIQNLKIPENSGKRIGLFRTLCAIFGGLIVALLAMAVLIHITPSNKGDITLVSIILDGSVWALVAFWVVLAPSKFSALLRCTIPSVVFTIALLIFYNS
ncbi:MAG: hypothetical protein PHS65_00970 [Arcobacteraceae bacterium]|nr:hypothetical protein [Arcobacteraceae bacterium]